MTLPWTQEQIAWAIALFVLSTVVTSVIVAGFLILIADDHFVAKRTGVRRKLQSPVTRAFWLLGKNLLGVILIVVGVFLSLPGVPGQGLLTILVGVLLVDAPGKRRLELAIVRREKIRTTIDRLRARFGRPPLLVEPVSEREPGSGEA